MRTILLASFVMLAPIGCSNSTVHQDWHRSRVIAEGRRPIGLPGQPVAPAYQPGERESARGATDASGGAGAASFDQRPFDPRIAPAFDGQTNSPINWFEVVARAAQADVVLIGELHGDPAVQSVLTTFWEDLLPQAPGAWLALEFFERDQQTAIDDYLAGVTTEDEFRKATNRTEGSYPAGHRAMLERAKAQGRPVIAANAPRRYARLARTAGFDRLQTLGPETQRFFSLPAALTEGPYRSRFEEVMRPMLESGEKAAAEAREQAEAMRTGDTTAEPQDLASKLEGYYRSQNLWDATMADSVARPALAGGRPVVLVVGQFHTDYNGGLAERVRSLAPGARVMTISLVDESPSQGASMRGQDAGRADVIVYLK